MALCLAHQLNGEIVSCDSMQVYQEITIASNQPSQQEQQDVVHHMINLISVKEKYDVVQYARQARAVIDDILKRKKLPIVVGGSGMYVQVLLDGIFEGAEGNDAVRQALLQELEEKGQDALYERLQKADPEAAAKIHPNNTKRLIRALEILQTQEKSFTELKEERSGLWDQYAIQAFCLHQDREELYQKINARVDDMFTQGLVDEVQSIMNVHPSLTADYLIGVKEVRGYLKGEYDIEQAKEKMKQNTRHFAKRQLTWFRRDDRLQWVERQADDSAQVIAEKILKEMHE